MHGIRDVVAVGVVPCPVIPGDGCGRGTVPERMRFLREGTQLQTQGKRSAGGGDDRKRFFADLRALRDAVALGYDELAARAHYPSEVLEEAANGPSLPNLPILAAYVRACEGDVPEWEERWRRLCFESPADPGLPVRLAGASPAAVAGARAGISVAPPEAYDPERIRAALRGAAHGRSDHGGSAGAARGRTDPVTQDPVRAEPRAPESPATSANWGDASVVADTHALQGTGARWETAPGWDTAPSWDSGSSWEEATADTSGNGSHYAGQPEDARPGAVVAESPEEFLQAEVPDEASAADAIRHDPFSTAWLRDSEPMSPASAESAWPDEAGAEASAAAQDNWFAPHQAAVRESAGPSATAEPSPVAPPNWFTPRATTGTGQADGGHAPPEPDERDLAPHVPDEFDVTPQREDGGLASAAMTDLWTPSAPTSSPSQAQRTGWPAAGDTVPRASWSAPAEASSAATPSSTEWMVASQSAAPTPSRTTPGPAVPSRPAVQPRPPVPPSLGARHPDRLSPVRLLVVIVVAALIGSVLVLILR